MKNILLIPGSQRRDSHNQRLADYLAAQLSSCCNAQVLDSAAVDLPLFNQDFESDPAVLERVLHLHKRIDEADGLVLVSPEYNGSFSPFLKNTVDWVSRIPRLLGEQGYRNPFYGKPMLLASATPGGSGGTQGLQHVRQLMVYLGGLVLAEQIKLPYAAKSWDEEGLCDLLLADEIYWILQRFAAVADALPTK